MDSNYRVFTNGCFDVLHTGHLSVLKYAKSIADLTGLGILIVGINSDTSIKRLKGSARPIFNEFERKEMLLSLSCVNVVYTFDEDTPYELIKEIEPDYIVKGPDYEGKDVIGSDLAKVLIAPRVNEWSTTKLIEKIKAT